MKEESWKGKRVLPYDPLVSMEPLTVVVSNETHFMAKEKGSLVFETKDFFLMDEDPGGGAS